MAHRVAERLLDDAVEVAGGAFVDAQRMRDAGAQASATGRRSRGRAQRACAAPAPGRRARARPGERPRASVRALWIDWFSRDTISSKSGSAAGWVRRIRVERLRSISATPVSSWPRPSCRSLPMRCCSRLLTSRISRSSTLRSVTSLSTASQWSAPSITSGVITQAAAKVVPSRRMHSNSNGSARSAASWARIRRSAPSSAASSRRNSWSIGLPSSSPWREAEDLVERRVGQADAVAPVDQHHAFAHRLEDARLQAQHLFVAPLAGDLGDRQHHADDRALGAHRLGADQQRARAVRPIHQHLFELRLWVPPPASAVGDEGAHALAIVRRREVGERSARSAARSTGARSRGWRTGCAATCRAAAASRSSSRRSSAGGSASLAARSRRACAR